MPVELAAQQPSLPAHAVDVLTKAQGFLNNPAVAHIVSEIDTILREAAGLPLPPQAIAVITGLTTVLDIYLKFASA